MIRRLPEQMTNDRECPRCLMQLMFIDPYLLFVICHGRPRLPVSVDEALKWLPQYLDKLHTGKDSRSSIPELRLRYWRVLRLSRLLQNRVVQRYKTRIGRRHAG